MRTVHGIIRLKFIITNASGTTDTTTVIG